MPLVLYNGTYTHIKNEYSEHIHIRSLSAMHFGAGTMFFMSSIHTITLVEVVSGPSLSSFFLAICFYFMGSPLDVPLSTHHSPPTVWIQPIVVIYICSHFVQSQTTTHLIWCQLFAAKMRFCMCFVYWAPGTGPPVLGPTQHKKASNHHANLPLEMYSFTL